MIGSVDFVNQKNYVAGTAKPSGAFIGQFLLYTNGSIDQWSGDSWVNISTDGKKHSLEQGIIGGGTNETDESNNHTKIRPVSNISIISKIAAVTIGGGLANDTNLIGLQIFNTLTGTCVITGFADSDGTATSITIPAGTTAQKMNFHGAINAAGALTVTCSNAADDNLVAVMWRPV